MLFSRRSGALQLTRNSTRYLKDEGELVAEMATSNDKSTRAPPEQGRSAEMRMAHGLKAPCQYWQGASLMVQRNPPQSGQWPRRDDFDIKEAASNFEAYLTILREWDEKGRSGGGE